MVLIEKKIMAYNELPSHIFVREKKDNTLDEKKEGDLS
jgi:hypothetical protein